MGLFKQTPKPIAKRQAPGVDSIEIVALILVMLLAFTAGVVVAIRLLDGSAV